MIGDRLVQELLTAYVKYVRPLQVRPGTNPEALFLGKSGQGMVATTPATEWLRRTMLDMGGVRDPHDPKLTTLTFMTSRHALSTWGESHKDSGSGPPS